MKPEENADSLYTWKDCLALAFLLLYPLYFFQNVVFFATHTLLANWDGSFQSFSWYAHVAQALQEGTIPFWDMHTEAGKYFPGELQTAAFYPVAWLFGLVFDAGDLHAFQFWAEMYSVFHFSLCGIFIFLFLKELKIRTEASLLGAVIGTYFGAIAERVTAQPNIHAGMVYVPAMLFFLQKAWNHPVARTQNLYAGLGGGMLAICILSGHLYSYIHGALIAFLVLALNAKPSGKDYKRVFKLLLILACTSLLVASVQLASMLEYFHRAVKWYGDGNTAFPHVVPFAEFSRWSFDSWETLLDWRCKSDCTENRTLYVGWTIWPLALIGFWVSTYAKRVVLPVLLIILLIAMAGDNLAGQILYRFPVLDNVRIPSRILFLFPLFVGSAGAFGFQYLLNRTSNHSGFTVALLLVIVLGLGADMSHQMENWQVTGTPRSEALYNPETVYTDPMGKELERLLGQHSPYRWAAEPRELLPPNLGQVNGTNSLRGHSSSMHANYYYSQTTLSDQSGWNPRLGLKYVVLQEPQPELNELMNDGTKYLYELPEPLAVVHGVKEGVHQPLPVKDLEWSTNGLKFALDTDYSPFPEERVFIGITSFPGWKLLVDGKPRELTTRGDEGAFYSAPIVAGDKTFTLSFRPRYLIYCLMGLGLYLLWMLMLVWPVARIHLLPRP